ncbi:hypothetical protein [Sulfolobus islandicus rod-shaped virus 2]|uniref:DUF1874 domain-containing protein n=1 Tax=Sulfolobus islandicus rod-shaped virus 2 TaxID=157899 RepID=Q8V9N2_SIRV2|nr:DUF1874 domain-containing protein [Sulfolobus islandicus rod-shaped virus 2]CAC87312.1 hypothetical protein [Sulfolobus islandicus rod-shaped virus 2]
MNKVYLANAFSINMLSKFPIKVTIDKIDRLEFCTNIDNEEIINAIGHDATIQLINSLCDTKLEKNRIEIKLDKNDKLYIIQISQRLEEGKILSLEEILKLYESGKVQFFEIIVD